MPDEKRSLIKSIDFSLFSPTELKRLSVVSVQESALFSQALPVLNGPCDLRMGTTQRTLKCATCSQNIVACPGHLGTCSLSYPVYHAAYMDVILKTLRCVCYFCSASLLHDRDRAAVSKIPPQDYKNRLAACVSACKNKKVCVSCSGGQPAYSKSGVVIKTDWSKVTFEDSDEQAYCMRIFTSSEARQILQHIPNEDVALLGFRDGARPEHMIMTILPVPPPCMRPSVSLSLGSKSRGNDDITSKIAETIKYNANLASLLLAEKHLTPTIGISATAHQQVNDLTGQISSYMYSENIRKTGYSFQRAGSITKTLSARLKGKDGRIRGSLMGKRVDFSARTVASAECFEDIDVLGVPQDIAMNLTVPVKATAFNIDSLKDRLRKGYRCLDGAKSVIKSDGSVILLEYGSVSDIVAGFVVGDSVERYLQDGDWTIVNRQPTLHRGSMLGVRVKIGKDKTFKLPLSLTTPQNCDFDGDCIAIYVVQSPEATAEIKHLMAAPMQIVSPQANRPMIAFVQDSILAGYLMTAPACALDRRLFNECRSVVFYNRQRPVDEAKTEWRGVDAIELALPCDLHYSCLKGDDPAVIVDGKITSGRFNKDVLGTANNSLIHSLFLRYGPERTKEVMSDLNRVFLRFMFYEGFSIRLSDCTPDGTVEGYVKSVIDFAEDKLDKITKIGHANRTQVEDACSNVTNKVLGQLSNVVVSKMSPDKNHIAACITAGSKGNPLNLAQILGAVGQQNLEGARIMCGDALGATDSLLDRTGFVRSSYYKGLSPREFFMHTMAGREGLVDTSVKTSTSGYLQRRLMKAFETLKVVYGSRCCVNNAGQVIQFVYGHDDYDAQMVVRSQDTRFLSAPLAELAPLFEGDEWAEFQVALVEARRAKLAGCVGVAFDTAVYTPLRVHEAFLYHGRPGTSDREAGQDTLRRFLSARQLGLYSSLVLRYHCRSRVLSGYTSESVSDIFAFLGRCVVKAWVAAGENVGALASQSLSEPLTQLMLDSHRSAGIKKKNVTLGVPRIKEIIDATRNMKTPSMTLRPTDPALSEAELAALCNVIAYLRLADVAEKIEFLREPDYFTTDYTPLDQELLTRHGLIQDAPAAYCPVVCRILLDPGPMVKMNIVPMDVAVRIEKECSCQVVFSSVNHEEWFLRVRFHGKVSEAKAKDMVSKILKDVVVVGIGGVEDASKDTETSYRLVDGDVVRQDLRVLKTVGSNLKEALSMPGVDPYGSTSNDLHDIYATLGVEATVNVLFNEVHRTLAFDGSYLNERHILILTDTMLRNGYIMPISRHGLNRLVESGPLQKASFEEVTEVLFDAACFGETERISGVTTCIMTGQQGEFGTGVCKAMVAGAATQPEVEMCEEDDECVFTYTGDMSDVKMSAIIDAVERPFSDNDAASNMSNVPFALRGQVEVRESTGFYPSSPRRTVSCKKRCFEPSSPRAP